MEINYKEIDRLIDAAPCSLVESGLAWIGLSKDYNEDDFIYRNVRIITKRYRSLDFSNLPPQEYLIWSGSSDALIEKRLKEYMPNSNQSGISVFVDMVNVHRIFVEKKLNDFHIKYKKDANFLIVDKVVFKCYWDKLIIEKEGKYFYCKTDKQFIKWLKRNSINS